MQGKIQEAVNESRKILNSLRSSGASSKYFTADGLASPSWKAMA
jgi:hypothetical protein